MFIILGSPRSGTTLLTAALDLNKDIAIPDETDFTIPIAFIIDRIKDELTGKELIKKLIISSERFYDSVGEYLSKKEIMDIVQNSEYSLSAILSNMYNNIAIKSGAKIAGDKSPNDLLYFNILVENGMFNENIKIIHIIRDIRDVMLSLNKVKWVSNDSIVFPRIWSNSNLTLHDMFKSKPDQYMLVKYEDILCNPREILMKVTDFLGVNFTEEMLNSENRGTRYSKYSHHPNINKPFLKDRMYVWKREMSKEHIYLCEKQSYEALQHFGYEITNNVQSGNSNKRKLFDFIGNIAFPRKEIMNLNEKLSLEIKLKENTINSLNKEISILKAPLVLKNFGPEEIFAGVIFNEQSCGESAIWVESENATNTTIVVLNDIRLQSTSQMDGKLVTAIVPKALYNTKGEYPLYLLEAATNKKSDVVKFIVR